MARSTKRSSLAPVSANTPTSTATTARSSSTPRLPPQNGGNTAEALTGRVSKRKEAAKIKFERRVSERRRSMSAEAEKKQDETASNVQSAFNDKENLNNGATATETRSTSTQPPSEETERTGSDAVSTPPRATPYWKALELDNRVPSPRATRSTTKKKRPQEAPSMDQDDDDGPTAQGILLMFSPPDQKANAERERKLIKQKEHERSVRIAKARDRGQMLVFSPPGRKKSKRGANTGSNDAVLAQQECFTLDLSPEPNDVEEELSSPNTNSADDEELFLAKEQLANAEEKLAIAQEGLSKARECCDDLEKQLYESQLQMATVRHDHEVDVGRMKEDHASRDNQLCNELDRVKNECTEAKQKLRHCQKQVEELEHQIDAQKREADAMKKQLEEKVNAAETLTMETREEHSKDQEEIALKEQTIRQLSSVLQITREKEQALETRVAQMQEEYSRTQDEHQSNANAELAAAQVAKVAAEAKTMEIEKQLKEAKRVLQVKVHECKASGELVEKERERFNAQRLEFEQKLEAARKEKELSEKDKHALEQKLALIETQLEEMRRAIETSEEQRRELSVTLDELTKQGDQKGRKASSLQRKLEESVRREEEAVAKAQQLSKDVLVAKSSITKLQSDLSSTANKLMSVMHDREMEKDRLEKFDAREDVLLRKLSTLENIRRDLHNKVMQLSGNIRTFIRVRPIIEQEQAQALTNATASASRGVKRKQVVEPDTEECPFTFPAVYERDTSSSSSDSYLSSNDLSKQVIIAAEPYKDRGGLKNRRRTWKFGFDQVFSPEHGQRDVWAATEPLVQSTIDGYNVCIFAYGQTGSGKTFTMIGGNDSDNHGLVYRAVAQLFQAKRELEASSSHIVVELSVELLEIYNEQVHDLLTMNKKHDRRDSSLKIQSNDAVGNVIATVSTEQDVAGILALAASRRCVKATNSNAESSRSHMLFTIHFVVQNVIDKKTVRSGKLHICDLAGSERLDKSGCHMVHDGSLLKETQNINKSLMCLSNVIEKLQAKESHIPYRDSKLTMLLQNSLGGDSKTLAIICCNPLAEHFQESMSSLRFASKVSRVELKAVAKTNV